MANYNLCVFVGNLTRDIETKCTQKGTTIAATGLAVNYKSKDHEETLFLDLAVFGDQANVFAKYLTKGSPVLVEGRLRLETWENKEGQKRSRHSLLVNRFQFLSSKGDDERGPAPPPRAQPAPAAEMDDEDLPF